MAPRLGFVVALPQEAASLTSARVAAAQCLELGGGDLLYVSGAGPEAAARGARALLQAGAEALLSWGCAGALAPDLERGALCLPERVLTTDGAEFTPSPAWLRQARQALGAMPLPIACHGGALLSLPRPAAGVIEKHALAVRHGAAAADMESAAVARIGHEAGRPFLAVRAIADRAGDPLPEAVTRAMDHASGEVRVGRLLAGALVSPRQWLPLLVLGRNFGAALATLRAAAPRLRALDPPTHA